MTFRRGGMVTIEREKPQRCQFCGKRTETRPYGPGGKRICVPCAQEPGHVEIVKENMKRFFKGLPPKGGSAA